VNATHSLESRHTGGKDQVAGAEPATMAEALTM
jgi:hypothetical protein